MSSKYSVTIIYTNRTAFFWTESNSFRTKSEFIQKTEPNQKSTLHIPTHFIDLSFQEVNCTDLLTILGHKKQATAITA